MKKVLILTGSYGGGHNAAAKALAATANQNNYDYKILDIVDIFYPIVGKISANLHVKFCEKFPTGWDAVFSMSDNRVVNKILYGLKNPLSQSKFDKEINEYNPDIVIITHFFWLGFIKHNIKEYGKSYKTGIVITDSINIHSLWYLKRDYIDYFFFIDNYSKESFKEKFNHLKDNLVTSFFPIEKKYFIDKNEIKNNNVYILLNSLEDNFVKDLLNLLKDSDIILHILKGRNDELYEDLLEDYSDVKNFDFIEYINIKDNLDKIDIMISKPGGALISECIAADIPIISPCYIPGQEEGNIKLLEYSEIGIFEDDPKKIVFYLKYFNWSKLIPNFHNLKNSESCETILNKLFEE